MGGIDRDMFEKQKKLASDLRAAEEALFELAWEEIEKDEVKSGLWAKAFASAKGDENATKAAYIALRVQELSADLDVSKMNFVTDQAEGLLRSILGGLKLGLLETGRIIFTVLATFSVPFGMMFSGILVGNYGYDYLGLAMMFGGVITIFTWPVLLSRIISRYEKRTGKRAVIFSPLD